MLEKCYTAANIREPVSAKINKLQTIPLTSSYILQVKNTDINGSFHYLDLRWVGVCVWGGGGGGGCQKHLFLHFPHAPQVGVTQSPTYQRSYGNPVPAGRNSVLELSFDA